MDRTALENTIVTEAVIHSNRVDTVIGGMTVLDKGHERDCTSLRTLQASIGLQRLLEELKLSGCSSLVALPEIVVVAAEAAVVEVIVPPHQSVVFFNREKRASKKGWERQGPAGHRRECRCVATCLSSRPRRQHRPPGPHLPPPCGCPFLRVCVLL